MTRVLCAGVAAVVLADGSAAAYHSYSAYQTDLVI
jgi:hypothetical protein